MHVGRIMKRVISMKTVVFIFIPLSSTLPLKKHFLKVKLGEEYRIGSNICRKYVLV